MRAYQLQKELDIAPIVAARLWRGKFEMNGISTLDKLCRALRASRMSCSRVYKVRNEKAILK